jgi:hypothetical protein
MSDNIQIGTTYAGRAYLSTFFNDSRDREPRAMPMEYLGRINAGDGTEPGSGGLTQVWSFGRLSEHYYEHLRAFLNTAVYVRTLKNDGTYGYYTAVFVGPAKEPEHFAGRVLGAEITLKFLVAYTPPS